MKSSSSVLVVLVAASLALLTLGAAIAFSDFLLPHLLAASNSPGFSIYASGISIFIGSTFALVAWKISRKPKRSSRSKPLV